jgi:hypothetical protein
VGEDKDNGNNVIPFPKQRDLSLQEVQQKAEQSQDFVTSLIIKNRRKGLDQLGNKLEKLNEREILTDPQLEHVVRELTMALQGTLTHLEALNSLMDMVGLDVARTVENLNIESGDKIKIAMHIQALIELLIEKELISHEEMTEVFQKKIKPQVEALQQQEEPTDSP